MVVFIVYRVFKTTIENGALYHISSNNFLGNYINLFFLILGKYL